MALSGNQWHSVALSGTQWHSVALSGTQWHLWLSQWQPISIRGDHGSQWHSAAVSGNPWQSVAIFLVVYLGSSMHSTWLDHKSPAGGKEERSPS